MLDLVSHQLSLKIRKPFYHLWPLHSKVTGWLLTILCVFLKLASIVFARSGFGAINERADLRKLSDRVCSRPRACFCRFLRSAAAFRIRLLFINILLLDLRAFSLRLWFASAIFLRVSWWLLRITNNLFLSMMLRRGLRACWWSVLCLSGGGRSRSSSASKNSGGGGMWWSRLLRDLRDRM